MHKKKILSTLVVLSLLTLTGCSDNKQESLVDDTNNVSSVNEEVKGNVKEDIELLDYEKIKGFSDDMIKSLNENFKDLKPVTTSDNRGIYITDNIVDNMGREYENYISAYSIYDGLVLQNVTTSRLELPKGEQFSKDDKYIKALYGSMESIGVNFYKNIDEFLNEINTELSSLGEDALLKVQDLGNFKLYLEEDAGKIKMYVVGVDGIQVNREELKIKNFETYEEYESVITSANKKFEDILLNEFKVEYFNYSHECGDNSVYGLVGVEDSTDISNDFSLDSGLGIKGIVDKRKDIINTYAKFINETYGTELSTSDIYETLKSKDELESYMSTALSNCEDEDSLYTLLAIDSEKHGEPKIKLDERSYGVYGEVYDDAEVVISVEIKNTVEGKENR